MFSIMNNMMAATIILSIINENKHQPNKTENYSLNVDSGASRNVGYRR